jgi:asparagine synthase (glutamine-hydrolysing)
MCGIIGYFQFQGAPHPELPRFVLAARDRLIHRGPDDAGLYISPDHSCVLGSRRLAIIDLSAAASQPMSNEDATLWLVFNGEIYNYKELRKELADNGHRFRSVSDTEVLLHLYEEHGPALLSYIDGIFSFVIYDDRSRRIFGARDRLGVKPLYYALSSYRFAFASEPKALLALPDVGREPRLEEVPSYLTFSCVPGPHTLFRDIEKLEPGTAFELTADGTFRRERYWLPGGRLDGERFDSNNLASALECSLSKAVAKRIVTDVPLGTTLSGGIDSSLIVALMTEVLGAPFKTFTIGYPGDEANSNSDLHFARLVARQFGTDHYEVIIKPDEFLAVLDEDEAELADDPIGSPSQTAMVHLARFAKRNGVTVIQVGEGSDEVFCGYSSVYQLWRFHERIGVLSHLLPRRFAGFLARAFGSLLERVVINPSKIGSLDGTLLEHLRRFYKGEHLYWGYGLLYCAQDHERLYGKALPPLLDPYERLRPKIAEVADFAQRPYLDQLAIIDLMLELPERLLMRVDKATMRYGVEAREPFLDTSVLKVAFQIPPKLRASSEKGFLKAFARGKLSPEILMRPKLGFPADSKIFMAPPVMSKIRESILAKRFVDFTGFDPSRLREFIAVCDTGRTNFFSHVWSIYILSLWFHHWIEARH